MTHTDWHDPSARLGAYLMTIIVISLIAMSALDRWPSAARAAEPYAVMVVATPRLTQLAPTAVPTEAPIVPTAAPPPVLPAPPVPEPIVVVQYVEVPVVLPATTAPPTPFPTVSHTRIEGWVEMERPKVFEGQPVRRPGDMPEAVGP